MAKTEDLVRRINEFRDARKWRQFHNPKDSAISLALEAAEVLEHMQWKSGEELYEYVKGDGKEELSEELMDVLYWVLVMSCDFNIDIEDAFEKKMKKNEAKYPTHLASGSAKKYTKF